MTIRPVRITAVSYLNTIPFLYGIRHAAGLRADLSLSPPSGCARAFDSRKADIALIPVGGLPGLVDKDFDIVTSWCIGADGPVRTVLMAGDSPLEEIRRVWLDSHSMTSVRLARLLAARYWNISPEWIDLADGQLPQNPEPGDAYVLIGDKVFDHESRFSHTWDLAAEWKKFTSLPFVFAVWVARRDVSAEIVGALEEGLTLGVERIYEAILESPYADRRYAYDYLTRNIDYFFDEQKRKALDRFWDEGLKTELKVNPG